MLTGPINVSRFNVLAMPEEELNFEAGAFQEIPPGSEVRESRGFLPMRPGEPYEVGAKRWAFRIRVDRLVPDPTLLRERLAEMVRSEIEAGGRVTAKVKRHLKEVATEDLVVETTPKAKIFEGVIDGRTCYVGSVSKTDLSLAMQLLRGIGVVLEAATPWADGEGPDDDLMTDVKIGPGESLWGPRFLRSLIGDREIIFEPEVGSVKIHRQGARISLSGEVLPQLLEHAAAGAEILAAKLVIAGTPMRHEGDSFCAGRLDALSWRLSALKVADSRHDHWTELLDERLEKVAEVFELLDWRFAKWMESSERDERPAQLRIESTEPEPGAVFVSAAELLDVPETLRAFWDGHYSEKMEERLSMIRDVPKGDRLAFVQERVNSSVGVGRQAWVNAWTMIVEGAP